MRTIRFGIIAICASALVTFGCDAGSTVAGPGINTNDSDAQGTVDTGNVDPGSDAGPLDDSGATPLDGGGGGGGICGDNKCEPPFETASTCPQDCKAGPGKIMQCISKQCVDRYNECLKDAICKSVVVCAESCSDQACVEKCAGTGSGGGFNLMVQRLMYCATVQKCIGDTPVPTCGDGLCDAGESPASCPADCKVGPGPICGNNICEPGEGVNSCPQDCGGTGEGPIECAAKKCPKEFQQCTAQPGCNKLIGCMKDCKSDDCFEKCVEGAGEGALMAFSPLASCAQQAGCGEGKPDCGNGSCDPGENPSSCPQDCKGPPPVCGDGFCTGGENILSCPKDCEGQPQPYCGDGKCSYPENKNNCAKDCGGGVDPVDCVKDKCTKAYKECVVVAECDKVMDCADKCDSLNCMLGCWQQGSQKAQQLFMPVAQCAQAQGCLSGGPPTPICGNGQCEQGESKQSCPKDCGGGITNNLIECGKKYCPKQLDQCLNQKGCSEAVNCMTSCSSDSCYEKCASLGMGKALQQFAQCAGQAGCFGGGTTQPVCGNGQCEPGESQQNCPKDCGGGNTGSCKGQCGKFIEGSSCQCDDQCQQYNDCCGDYKELCSGPNPGPVCGNGICQPPVETSQNCPKDCGSTAKQCKSKADCTDAQICCGMPDGQYCVAIGKCG